VKIGDTWTKNRTYRRYIGIADIWVSPIFSYRFGKSDIDPSLVAASQCQHSASRKYGCSKILQAGLFPLGLGQFSWTFPFQYFVTDGHSSTARHSFGAPFATDI